MSIETHPIIEKKLKFLALTIHGKYMLLAFSEKALFKALCIYQKVYGYPPQHPFSAYYSLCIYESDRLGEMPNWQIPYSFNNFEEDEDMTLHGEKYDHDRCVDMKREFKVCKIHNASNSSYLNSQKQKKHPQGKSYDTQIDQKKSGTATFNRDIMYYKYGHWYKYPDQKWCRESRPSLPVSSSQAKWLIERGHNPKQILNVALLDNVLAEEQISIFHLYEAPLMKEFLAEQNGERPRTNPVSQGKPKLPFSTDLEEPKIENLSPPDELKKVIRSGSINKKGLAFLRETFSVTKPELIPIIDAYLNDEATTDDAQFNLFKEQA